MITVLNRNLGEKREEKETKGPSLKVENAGEQGPGDGAWEIPPDSSKMTDKIAVPQCPCGRDMVQLTNGTWLCPHCDRGPLHRKRDLDEREKTRVETELIVARWNRCSVCNEWRELRDGCCGVPSPVVLRPKTEMGTEVKSETKSEVPGEVKTETKSEDESEMKTEESVKTESKGDPKFAADTSLNPDLEMEWRSLYLEYAIYIDALTSHETNLWLFSIFAMRRQMIGAARAKDQKKTQLLQAKEQTQSTLEEFREQYAKGMAAGVASGKKASSVDKPAIMTLYEKMTLKGLKSLLENRVLLGAKLASAKRKAEQIVKLRTDDASKSRTASSSSGS